jgi:hypothetical protein
LIFVKAEILSCYITWYLGILRAPFNTLTSLQRKGHYLHLLNGEIKSPTNQAIYQSHSRSVQNYYPDPGSSIPRTVGFAVDQPYTQKTARFNGRKRWGGRINSLIASSVITWN